jgi:hypothetical protein
MKVVPKSFQSMVAPKLRFNCAAEILFGLVAARRNPFVIDEADGQPGCLHWLAMP